MRFGFNVNADGVFIFSQNHEESGVASFTTNFTIAPGNYDLTITARRVGALRRSADELGCNGAITLAEMTAPVFIVNGLADERLSEFFFPGATITDGGSDADAPVPDVVQSQVILFRGRTLPDEFSLSFQMSVAAVSNWCEVSARLGAPNLSTNDCQSCDYPGTPARTIEDDGLFVEVRIEDRCGDGTTQVPEQCDLGGLNGEPSSCCNFDCTFKEQGRVCRSSTGLCDPAELCSGEFGSCPFDRISANGDPCAPDDNPCTSDLCDDGACIHPNFPNGSGCPSDDDPCTIDRCTGGICTHPAVPPPCPALCGNQVRDEGEDCDQGVLNGAVNTCCASDCSAKPEGTECRFGLDPCSPFGSCDGLSNICGDLTPASGMPCPDEGDFCTEDRCSGTECLHTPKPELCPNLFCGNGRIDGVEECDVGSLNGDPTSCCDALCKRRPDNSTCDDGLFCNVTDRCTSGVCGGSAGNPCSDLGACARCDETNNVCNTSQCPNGCGNGQLDSGEECDLGASVNGRATNCCDVSCKKRPDNFACTDELFCNGAEHCSGGECGGSAGNPCSSRACASCDESANVCDTSACPPGLPDQPTRELLITEIFDGDGDGYATSAGGRVRGTLDLDANADLRFTAADLPRLPRCAADAVLVGGVCIDKYEASVFENPPGSADLGTHYGVNAEDYPCRADGSDCPRKVFAHSLAGSTPSVNITWFQAQQACASVGKRLPTNAEWQMAAAGTPDSGNDDDEVTSCNTNSAFVPVASGSRSACVSKWGIYDMVGNAWEWVAEWVPASTDCPGWGTFSDDTMCLAGASLTATGPGALIRGGGAAFTTEAGPLAIRADFPPSQVSPAFGFRCARAPF